MSLYVPPMFERVPVYREDGEQVGFVMRRCKLADGEVLCPLHGSISEAVALIKQVEDDARFD